MKCLKMLMLGLFTISFLIPANSYALESRTTTSTQLAPKLVCNQLGCADPSKPPATTNAVQYNSWCCILGMSCCGGEEKKN